MITISPTDLLEMTLSFLRNSGLSGVLTAAIVIFLSLAVFAWIVQQRNGS